jgi:hypothetical protein
MDPLTTSIVVILGKYALDKGVELGREAGPQALEAAKEMFALALERLRREPKGELIAGEFEKDPQTYQKPLEKALGAELQADPDFAAQLKALLARYEQAAQPSRRISTGGGAYVEGDVHAGTFIGRDRVSHAAEVHGPGAIAQGPGAVAAGEGGVVQFGGIRADRIEAENVVDGVQMQGGDAEMAAGLVKLARAIRRGGISAEEIKAQSLVSGLQYIADPARPTPDELRREIAALREQVEKVVADGEIAEAADAQDAQEALAKAEEELAASQPQGGRVVRKLAEVSEILTRSAEAAQAAGKFGWQVVKLAPLAAALWQIAARLWGG